MSKVQTPTTIIHDAKGSPIAVVLTWTAYNHLRKGRDEEAELVALATPHRGEESFPAKVANRLIDGETPLKVMREWRELTQAELANRAKVATQYVSQIERGTKGKKLGRDAAAKLARVLNVSAEVLMDL